MIIDDFIDVHLWCYALLGMEIDELDLYEQQGGLCLGTCA